MASPLAVDLGGLGVGGGGVTGPFGVGAVGVTGAVGEGPVGLGVPGVVGGEGVLKQAAETIDPWTQCTAAYPGF